MQDVPLTGVWDQVVAFGQYQHETVNGDPVLSIHDGTTCKVMLDDFAAHPDCDIFYDKQHEVEPLLGAAALDRETMLEWGKGDGHALAWANAMCMVIGGQVVRYEPHPGAPSAAPHPDEVLIQSDGTRRSDGVYCLRSQVTPRGADPVEGLGNFRQTSPYYVPERDGNRLLNLTVTNDPRMRGCALAFSRTSAPIAMQRIAMGKTASSVSGSGGVIKVDGRQAYWFSVKDLRAWNSSTEWDLTSEQANQLARECPQCNADNSARPSGNAKQHDNLYNEGKGGYNPYRKMENSMDPEMMKAIMEAAGCKAEDKAEDKLAKMTAYASKMEDARKAMESEKDAAEMARKKMESDKKTAMGNVFSAKKCPKCSGGDLDTDDGKMITCEDCGWEGPVSALKMESQSSGPDGDEPEKMQAMSRRLSAAEEKNRMLAEELKEVRSFGAQFKAQQEKLAADNAKVWAQNAVGMRRVKPSRCGTEEQTVAWLAAKRLKEGDAAEDVLCDVGTFGEPEQLLMSRRIIENGAPAGAPDPREGGLTVDDEMDAAIAKETKALIGAGEDPKKKDLYRMSMQRIAKSNPSLHRRFLAANGSN